jgi:hypothetical protein
VAVFFGEGGVAQLSGDPLCERCHQVMEPVPPVGWICLSDHEPGPEYRDAAESLAISAELQEGGGSWRLSSQE